MFHFFFGRLGYVTKRLLGELYFLKPPQDYPPSSHISYIFRRHHQLSASHGFHTIIRNEIFYVERRRRVRPTARVLYMARHVFYIV